jgi:hypothetical protein
VAVLAIAGCGGDDNSSGTTDITPAQAEVLGGAAIGQLGSLASSLTHFSTPGVGGIGGGFFAPSAPGGRVLFSRLGSLHPQVKASLASLFRADECGPDESDETDTDEDGVPDDDVATFSAVNCTSTDTTETNLITTTVTGTVRVQDTDDGNTIFGYRVGIASLTVTITDTMSSTADISVSVTGDFNGDVQTGLANASQNLRTTLRINGSKAVVDHATFAVNYTPTSGEIALDEPTLPPGDLTLNGTYTWNGSYLGAEGDWSFSLTTPEALVFDGCDDDEFVFESGRMQGVITARRSVGFYADYSGCGIEPTITTFTNTAAR